MSLQVWLPLNGNIKNLGVGGAVFNSLGTWIYDDGKVTNQCMNTNIVPSSESASNCVYTTTTFKYDKNFSVSVWVKLPETSSQYNAVIACEGRYANLEGNGWYIKGTNGLIGFRFGDSSRNVTSLSSNKWYLATMTIDDNGLCSYFIDGVLKGSFTPTILPTYDASSGVSVGCAKYNNVFKYQWDGLINDFRLYDHCLSIKEIKNLAKGLMLHYTLSRPQANLFLNSTNPTSYGFNASTGITYSKSTTDSALGEITYTISANTSTSTSGYIGPYVTFTDGGFTTNGTTYTTSFECWCNHDATFVMLGAEGGGNAGASTIKANRWIRIVKTGTRGSSTSKAVIMYGLKELWSVGTIFKIRKFKIEYGSSATPWIPGTNDALYSKMGLGNNIEADTSGYNNNGTRTNITTWNSNTPRYIGSMVFNGSNSYIRCLDPIKSSTTEFTISAWVYLNNVTSTMCLWNGRSAVGPSVAIFIISARVRFDDSNPTYVSAELTANKWIHIVGTWKSGGNKILYVDGVHKDSVTAGTLSKSNTYATIGLSSNADGTPSGNAFNGRISDFRIYATALSDDDVLELYHTSASIDKDGNMHCYEVVEN